jgi:Na+-driven multidrug efflux pump
MLFNVAYVLLVWLILWQLADLIITGFSAGPEAAALIRFYTHYLVAAFLFTGGLFIANASFNNLHRPRLATAFNFARVFLGVIPAVYLGASWYGPRGVLAGEAVGSVVFGLVGVVAVFVFINRLERQHLLTPPDPGQPITTVSTYSSAASQMAQPVVQADAEEPVPPSDPRE